MTCRGNACTGCYAYYHVVNHNCSVDIDECSQGTAGCNQGCNNTEGSFICTCNDGY